jgi:hypothetical protein
MTIADDLSKFARIANAAINSMTANSTAITSMTVGGASINATSFPGTANNATFMNGNNVVTVMQSLRANRNLTGGGTITVDQFNFILWSQRFIVISNGRGSHFSTVGYFDINCPTSGTITGVGGASNKTATAAGIPLGAWEALYYIMPAGSDQTSVAANFRVVSYTSNLEIPSDWLLICVYNGDDGKIYFNNGIKLEPGQSYVGADHTSVRVGSNTFTIGTAAYFLNNGNIGIGTSDPSFSGNVGSRFTIVANSAVSTALALAANSTQLSFAINPATNGSWTMFDRAANGGIGVWTAGITQSNGNIGIGTTSPNAKLAVNGAMSSTGRYTRSTASGINSPSARFALTTSQQADYHIASSINGAGTSNTQQYGLTFSPAGGSTQAGILFSENGTDGTAIGFFNTNNYAAGPQLRASLDPVGNFNTAGTITQNGTAVVTNNGGSWGISVTGNAATVTNGVYTSGDQTIGGTKTFNGSLRHIVSSGWSNFYLGGQYNKYAWFHMGGDTGSNDLRVARINRDTFGWEANPFTFDLAGGISYATGSMRSPVFFDLDDTNSYFEGANLFMRSNAPTIYFRDTDHNSAMIHCNGNLLYVLRGGNDTTSWSTVRNGNWPVYFNLTNNDLYCGGDIYAVVNVVAYASDKRLKENIKEIPNAIEKIKKIRGVTFDWSDKIDSLGFTPKQKYDDVGVIAQEIEEVLPQVVAPAPFDIEYDEVDRSIITSKSGENYKTVQYERVVPLLIQAIKEQQAQIEALQAKIMEIQ